MGKSIRAEGGEVSEADSFVMRGGGEKVTSLIHGDAPDRRGVHGGLEEGLLLGGFFLCLEGRGEERDDDNEEERAHGG
ncbi:MAG: hypothetical protein AAF191_00975 [Verrucomicrobiota bacterium]